jgi:predicted HTH domain antitoxin
MKSLTIEIPPELVELLGSEEEAKRGAKVALILDLVRRGKLSRGKAAELLGMSLWDLPALLAQYRIPWFDYSAEDLQRDLTALCPPNGPPVCPAHESQPPILRVSKVGAGFMPARGRT